jgi:hypothetical protein
MSVEYFLVNGHLFQMPFIYRNKSYSCLNFFLSAKKLSNSGNE